MAARGVRTVSDMEAIPAGDGSNSAAEFLDLTTPDGPIMVRRSNVEAVYVKDSVTTLVAGRLVTDVVDIEYSALCAMVRGDDP